MSDSVGGLKTPVVPRVACMSDPGVPQFEFQWHPHTGKVYVGETPGEHVGGQFVPAVGGVRKFVVVAEHCEHHARFYGFVQSWLRGYKKAVTDYHRLRESSLVKRTEELRHSGLLRGETDV